MDHKRQHWVPQGYLKTWCDPSTPSGHEPYVWQFTKDGSAARKRSPKKIFQESELYTIKLPDGARDLRVEHGLAGLESDFVRIRETKLVQGLPLGEEEHLLVCVFIAAIQSRTPFFLDHWRSNWERVAQIGRDLQHAIDAGDRPYASLPGGGPTFSQDDVESLASAERGALLVPLIETQIPILLRMNLSLFESRDALGFITSDSPCVWF